MLTRTIAATVADAVSPSMHAELWDIAKQVAWLGAAMVVVSILYLSWAKVFKPLVDAANKRADDADNKNADEIRVMHSMTQALERSTASNEQIARSNERICTANERMAEVLDKLMERVVKLAETLEKT